MKFFQDKNNPDYGWKKPFAWLLVIMLAAMLGDIFDVIGDSNGAEFIISDGDFEQRMPEPDPNAYSYISPNKVWNGRVDFVLNMNDSPFAQADVVNAIEWAIEYINLYIEWDAGFQGLTNVGFVDSWMPSRAQTVLVGFKTDFPCCVMADAVIWWDWRVNGWIDYGQIRISTKYLTQLCLRGTMLHEMLHTLNIAHSPERHSIMFNAPYHDCLYMATLRLDDIEALQSLYKPRPNRQGVITSVDSSKVCGYQPEVMYQGQSYQVSACTDASGFGEIVFNE